MAAPDGRSGGASLSADDMSRYADVMEQVKRRVDVIAELLELPPTFPRVESAALQMRSCLELLALSTLITHREAVSEVATALHKRAPDEAIKLVRSLNPHFWPQPSLQRVEDGRPVEMVPIEDGYLAEAEWAPAWGRLSAWLHARNPFVPVPDPAEGVLLVDGVLLRFKTLLNHHSVQLMDRDQLLVCLMHDDQHGRVQVVQFERVPSPDAT